MCFCFTYNPYLCPNEIQAPMKRLFYICMMCVLATVSAFSQVEFGVRAGGAYSSLVQKIEKDYESGGRFGFNVAGLMEVPLYKGLSLRPEIAFVNQGGDYFSYQTEAGMNAHNKYSYYSIQVPVNVAYTFYLSDIRLSVFVGPAFDFSLFGKMKTEETNVSTDIDFGSEKEPNLRTFDFGISAGMSVEYKRFFFTIQNLTGLLDRRTVKREGESTLFQNNVTFSIGYFFRKN